VSPYRADTPATTELRFQARVATVRSLIRQGLLEPIDGLAYVTIPTEAMLAAEAKLSESTCYYRARRDAA
jgi:hypothetical protein